MIPPQVMIFLAQIAVLSLIAALYYTYHKIDQGGFDRATALYEARDAKDAVKAAGILAAAEKSVADKAKENDQILIGVLTHNDAQIKNLVTERDAALGRSLRITTTQTNADRRNALSRKAGVLQGDDPRGESTCDQELASDNKRKLVDAEYQIARMATLYVSCIEQIERTHILK